MKKCVFFSLLLVSVLVLTGCNLTDDNQNSYDSSPPPIPQDVLAAWATPAPPNNSIPSLSNQVTLEQYEDGTNSQAQGSLGVFQAGDWVDIVVKSADIPIHFFDNQARSVGIGLSAKGTGLFLHDFQSLSDYIKNLNIGGDPNQGKFVYSPNEYLFTQTENGGLYTAAYRLCIPKSGVLEIVFQNYHPTKTAHISYEVYQLSISTPDWIEKYHSQTLTPWLQTLPEDKQQELLLKWYEQFK